MVPTLTAGDKYQAGAWTEVSCLLRLIPAISELLHICTLSRQIIINAVRSEMLIISYKNSQSKNRSPNKTGIPSESEDTLPTSSGRMENEPFIYRKNTGQLQRGCPLQLCSAKGIVRLPAFTTIPLRPLSKNTVTIPAHDLHRQITVVQQLYGKGAMKHIKALLSQLTWKAQALSRHEAHDRSTLLLGCMKAWSAKS